MEKCIKGAGAEAGSERRRGNKWDDVKEHSLFLYPLFFCAVFMAGLALLLKRRNFQAGSPITCSRGPIKSHQLLPGEKCISLTHGQRRTGGQGRQKDNKEGAKTDKATDRLRRMESEKTSR